MKYLLMGIAAITFLTGCRTGHWRGDEGAYTESEQRSQARLAENMAGSHGTPANLLPKPGSSEFAR